MARFRYGFTEDKIARYEKDGRGQGRGPNYKPWLTIQDVPSSGRSHRLKGLKTGRTHHLLSDLERNTFYLYDWADSVSDIREQYPLDRRVTQQIAEQIGVRHPKDTKSGVPLVMTTDLLIDIKLDNRSVQIARTAKYVKDLEESRVLEKLEIERRYWGGQNVDWGIVTEEEIPATVVKNIGWLHRYRSLERAVEPYPNYFEEKAGLILQQIERYGSETRQKFCCDMDDQLRMKPGTCLLLLRHLLATKAVICDLTQPAYDDAQPMSRFQSIQTSVGTISA